MVGVALGGIGPIAVGALLVPLRDEVDNANLALVLMFVVTVAAIVGGRGAGALAAVTSTFAFDFFLTRPFLSVRIDTTSDIETAAILLAVGLLVGEVASRGRRSRSERDDVAETVMRVHRVADRIAHDASLDEVAALVKRELTALLGLSDCWIELPPFTWVLPRLERAGTLGSAEHRWLGDGFTLPQDGVELLVLDRGREAARLVLLADPDAPAPLEARIVAVALADQLGAAVALASPDDLRGAAVDRSQPDAD